MRLIELFWRNETGSMVASVAKASLAIGLLSVLAANFIAGRTDDLDRRGLDEATVAAARSAPRDPQTTGSIVSKASTTRLDPCALPR